MPIARTEFGSGLRVVTERMPSVRSVSLGFWVLAGSRDEAPAISGSSHFLEHLLFKGTKTRSAQDDRARTSTRWAATSTRSRPRSTRATTRGCSTVTSRWRSITSPTCCSTSLIRKADLDAERQVILEEINMHEDSPEDVVHDLFTETLWPEHPLGRPILGTVDTIEAATPASREALLPPALRARAASWWRRPGTCGTTTWWRCCAHRMDTGRVVRSGRASGLEPAQRRPCAGAVGARPGEASQDRAGQHLPRHERPRPRPTPIGSRSSS